jgi:hypothetical protein
VLQPARRELIDMFASFVAAGEGDFGDIAMRDERLTHLATVPGDDVHDAGRESSPLEKLAERER